MSALDARLYEDVNGLARHSSALHGLGSAWFAWLGFVVLAASAGWGWWKARFRPDAPDAVAASVWALTSAGVGVLVAQPMVSALGRVPPYRSHPAEVLGGVPPGSPSFPSLHAVVAGAVVAGLWWAGTWARGPAVGATVTGLVLAFACVYTGRSYPGDVLAGLALGGLVAALGRPLGLRVLSWVALKVERSPLHLVVAAHRA